MENATDVQRWDQARERVEWELSKIDFAALIINAYTNPQRDAENMNNEKANGK